MSETEKVAKFAEGLILAKAPILGAKLGAQLRRRFPTFDWKHEFGNLRNFIQSCCDEKVHPTAKEGLDDIYGPSGSSKLPIPPGAWAALTNPASPHKFVISPETHEMQILPSSAEAPADTATIALSAQDYKDMAGSFLDKNELRDVPELVTAIEAANFWPSWSYAIHNHEGGSLYERWSKFRLSEIHSKISKSLQQIGFQEEGAQEFIEQLSKKRATKSPTKLTSSTKRRSNRPPFHNQSASIQALAHSIIDRMSEQELRQLSVTLGTVMDALANEE